MAFITLSGTLLDPNGDLAVGDQIRFTHKSTTGETVESAVSLITISPTGTYSLPLQYGLVLVEYKDVRTQQFKNLGVATVNGANPATSIPELLNAIVPVSSAELIEFQAILADCVTAQTAAENAATTAEAFAYQLTTTDLIASTATFAAATNIPTSGFTTSGDGGNGSWKQNGITGQPPSQSPAQLGDALLNDGNGNQWGLVLSAKYNDFTDTQLGVVKNTDSTSAFLACDAFSASSGATLNLTVPFEVTSKYNPSAGVTIRGTYRDEDAITMSVAGDGVEINYLCDIDGIVFDGGKVGTARVTAGAVGALFGVNGGTSYLDKFKLGRIKVINDPRRTGICIVNISNGEVGPFETYNTDGHAVLMSGIKDTKIKEIGTRLNGDLNVNGSRLGAGLAFFREANAGKAPAQWYLSANVLDTSGVRFKPVNTFMTTDTSIYVHNDSGQPVFNDIEIESSTMQISGKDGLKVRSNVAGFTSHSTSATKISGKAVAVEASCGDINIPAPTITSAGYDGIGDITGTPSPWTGGTGLGESLQDLPIGLYVENCFRVSSEGAVIRGVARNPDNGSDGHGVRVVGTDNSDISAITSNIGGSHSRISGCNGTNVTLNAEVDSSSVASPATIYFSDDGFGPSSNCKAKLTVTADATTDTTYPIRVNGACVDIEASVTGDTTNYTRVDGLTVRVDVAASNVTYEQAFQKLRNENVTFDASGLGTLTYGKTLSIPYVSAAPVGTSIFLTQLYAIGTTDATIRLLDTSFAVAPSTTRVVTWTVKQSMEANGWA